MAPTTYGHDACDGVYRPTPDAGEHDDGIIRPADIELYGLSFNGANGQSESFRVGRLQLYVEQCEARAGHHEHHSAAR